jgi:NADH:ubiquinone reductase (H+-translocating)
METRVVIVGAGFGGAEVARRLGSAAAHVILVDQHNYQLFQPLLYQVATAALSPADIAEPVRRLVRGQPNVEVLLGEVVEISADERNIVLADGSRIAYDILVIAAGATATYFGHYDWARFAPSLKSISDARNIRSRLLRAFEEAETTDEAAERSRLMTFVVVGGGPSGVELAGSIAELARYSLAEDFRKIDPKSAVVLLVEKGPGILSMFPKELSDYAARKLKALGVTVRLNCAVKSISETCVETEEETIPVAFAIWTAGVKASPVAKMLGVPTDKAGRIETNRDLSVPGFADVYALGDAALARDDKGNPLPGLAQVAKQQGKYLGNALARRLQSKAAPGPFVFHNRGNVAVIGRHAAVIDFGWLRLTGIAAWLLWALIHIYLLAGLQHRLLVAVQWLWRYLTYDRGARIIVEPKAEGGEPSC